MSKKIIHMIATAALSTFLLMPCHAEESHQPEQPSSQAPSTQHNETKIKKEDMLKLSEAFGHFIGKNLNTCGMNFDMESLIKGIREGAAGKPAPMSDEEYEAMMAAVQEQAFKECSEKNMKDANNFLKENAKTQGIVIVIPDKLQYLLLKEGQGDTRIDSQSTPLIHYTGKFLDGTVFSSSEQIGEPIPLSLEQTIPGFSQGMIGMKEGERRRLFIHPELAYGMNGQLPPNSLLIFDVEIIKTSADLDDDLDLGPLSDDGSLEIEPSDDEEKVKIEPTK